MKKNSLINGVTWMIVCIAMVIIFVYPLVYSFVNSLRSVYSAPIFSMPSKPEWKNYVYAVTLIPFFRYMKSTLIITFIKIFFGVTVSFVYGYAFARLRARGKKLLFMILLSQMMIPGIAISIPQYITFASMGLKNTYWIWILNGIGGDLMLIFTYKQYLESIPREIDEAAYLDGCGFLRMIPLIYVPICKNILIVGFFTCLLAGWGDYMTATMFVSEKMYPLATALFGAAYEMADKAANVEPIQLAASMLFAAPLIIVFFLCQKNLSTSTMAGSVKG